MYSPMPKHGMQQYLTAHFIQKKELGEMPRGKIRDMPCGFHVVTLHLLPAL